MTTQSASSGWWAKFTFNGITRYDQGAYGLVGGVAAGFCAAVELSDAGTWPKASVAEPLREELLQLCRQRLDAFRMPRGEEVGCLLTQKPAASCPASTPLAGQLDWRRTGGDARLHGAAGDGDASARAQVVLIR